MSYVHSAICEVVALDKRIADEQNDVLLSTNSNDVSSQVRYMNAVADIIAGKLFSKVNVASYTRLGRTYACMIDS